MGQPRAQIIRPHVELDTLPYLHAHIERTDGRADAQRARNLNSGSLRPALRLCMSDGALQPWLRDGALPPRLHEALQPRLREAPQYGLRVLAAVDPDNPAVLRFIRSGGGPQTLQAEMAALPEETTVSVVWPVGWLESARGRGAGAPGASDASDGYKNPITCAGWRLEARECGSGDLVASAEKSGSAPELALALPAGARAHSRVWRCVLLPPGATDVGEAAAVLHVHGAPRVPRLSSLALTAMQPPPLDEAAAALVPAFRAAERLEEAYAARLPRALQERGFGVEIELLVLPPSWSGHATKASELKAALAAAGLASRLGHWPLAVDLSVEPFLPASAEAACAAAVPPVPIEWAEQMARVRGCTAVELKSPLPPRELRLGRGALADVRLAAHLMRWRGCAAPDCGERGAAAMLHVHVNVRKTEAGGEQLTSRELLCVFGTWLQFEHVTGALARSWLRRDRWCGPLYATGPELAFRDKPWQQGERRPLPPGKLDAPAFLRRAHALWQNERLEELDEDERVRCLFAETPGRLASLNVAAVNKTGTVEFRRHHATTCGVAVRNWCLFCVAFLEAARTGEGSCLGRGAEVLLGAPSPEGALSALREAQLRATSDGLVALLARALGEGEARVLVDAMAAESCACD